MLAYYNDPKIKNDILSQLADHASADQIVKGQYWKNGKGCAVGCTIHSGNHMDYEDRFGIPVMLARLEDRIFEGLPNEAAMKWPTRFMSAIEPGADLSLVGWKFQYWLLTDAEVNPGINHPLVKDSIKQCADVLIPLTKGQPVDQKAANAMNAERSAARSAASAAWSAAESAESAAESAESAAESAESAARSAESAASAARSAGSAARSAESAAWSTARSAMNAARSAERSAASAACAERSTERAESSYTLMADKILTLLSEAQPPSELPKGES